MLSFPIETIIFDLDGTLRYSRPSADDVQFRIAKRLGAVDDLELKKLGARWAHYYWAQSTEFFNDIEKFEGLNEDFWIQYSIRYLRSMEVSKSEAAELAPILVTQMEIEYTPENCVYPCVPDTLKTLQEFGFRIGLVSNRSDPCQTECEELGLLGFFEFAYVAVEVGAWKPDPRIFDRALEITGSLPEHTIYVGDNYYADILGARKAGIQPVLLDGKGLFPEADCPVIRYISELISLVIFDY